MSRILMPPADGRSSPRQPRCILPAASRGKTPRGITTRRSCCLWGCRRSLPGRGVLQRHGVGAAPRGAGAAPGCVATPQGEDRSSEATLPGPFVPAGPAHITNHLLVGQQPHQPSPIRAPPGTALRPACCLLALAARPLHQLTVNTGCRKRSAPCRAHGRPPAACSPTGPPHAGRLPKTIGSC